MVILARQTVRVVVGVVGDLEAHHTILKVDGDVRILEHAYELNEVVDIVKTFGNHFTKSPI
jgi:hypothetical protein